MQAQGRWSCATLAALWVGVVAAKPYSIPLPLDLGRFAIDVPDDWTAAFQQQDAPGGTAIRVTPPKGFPLELLVTPFPTKGSKDPLAQARSSVQEMAERLAEQSVEEQIPVKEIEGPTGHGYYVSATDRTVTA